MNLVDLELGGTARTIACWCVRDVMIDCGPSSCLDRLLCAVADWRPRILLLTHIHLDHAGAAGVLAQHWPDLTVYVHERGAPHLVSPERLIASAARLYGSAMSDLWGAVEPVPSRQLRSLSGGEMIEGFRVLYTPGHASHHVSFLDMSSGRAFVGDAAGVRIVPADLVVPHAPPPDIDLAAWETSLDRLGSWKATSLHLPHFGTVTDPERHLDEIHERLRKKAELARRCTVGAYADAAEQEMVAIAPELRDAYKQCAPAAHSHAGLRRYFDRQTDRPGHS